MLGLSWPGRLTVDQASLLLGGASIVRSFPLLSHGPDTMLRQRSTESG